MLCPHKIVVAFVIAVMAVAPGWGQPPDGSGGARKPLRERLLERALKGDAEAQFDLGKNYEGGRIGLPEDFTQAEHWYRAAAGQGEPFAQASLGIFYNLGKGVKRDYVLAYMWFERAASHLTGADRDTVVEMRESVGRRLTAGQLAEAHRLAEEPMTPAVKP